MIFEDKQITLKDGRTAILRSANENDAEAIMMKVHKGGKAIVGIYSYDIAMTKVELATKLARQEGFPFKIKVEK